MKNRGKIFRFNLVILAITSATAASSAVIRESTQMDCPSMGRLHVCALIPAWRRKKTMNESRPCLYQMPVSPQITRYVAMTHPTFVLFS
jgi:hypothetical protein